MRADAKYGWALQFKDGWGRSEANGQKLEWNITKGADGTWKKMTFNVPPTWVQPITIDGVLVHNWESQNQKASAILGLDQLEVETDIADVDAETGILKTWKAPPLRPAEPCTGAKTCRTSSAGYAAIESEPRGHRRRTTSFQASSRNSC